MIVEQIDVILESDKCAGIVKGPVLEKAVVNRAYDRVDQDADEERESRKQKKYNGKGLVFSTHGVFLLMSKKWGFNKKTASPIPFGRHRKGRLSLKLIQSGN